MSLVGYELWVWLILDIFYATIYQHNIVRSTTVCRYAALEISDYFWLDWTQFPTTLLYIWRKFISTA